MDGFNQTEYADRYAYTQFEEDQIQAYWNWAEEYVLADAFFASAVGPSFPNHLYTIAARSGGAHDNPTLDLDLLREHHRETGLFKAWGCDSIETAYVPVEDREGNVKNVPPCFDFLTEGDLLTEAGIPWAYYAATNMQNGYLWSAYDAIRHIREDPEISDMVMARFRAEGIEVRVGTRAKEFVVGNGAKVLVAEHDGREGRIPFDTLLCAVGRGIGIMLQQAAGDDQVLAGQVTLSL